MVLTKILTQKKTSRKNTRNDSNSRNFTKSTNIAGRLPENSRNSFVDLQSQKTVKKTKKIVFSLKTDLLYFDLY